MAISYSLTNSHHLMLTYVGLCSTIEKLDNHEEESNATDGKTTLHYRAGSTAFASNRVHRQRMAQTGQDDGYQGTSQLAYQRRGHNRVLAQVPGGTAKQEIVSPDINVKSHCRYRLDNFLRQWPRKPRSRFYLIGQASFVLIITTFRSFSKHEGGKCVAS